MNKFFFFSLLILAVSACKPDHSDLNIPDKAAPSIEVAGDRSSPCDRNAVKANYLAPLCFSGTVCPDPTPSFDYGELNEHVNGCPVPYSAFYPKTEWMSLESFIQFCSGSEPMVSVAEQDVIIAQAKSRADFIFNLLAPGIDCNTPSTGTISQKKKLTYRIHFEYVIMPCICDEEHKDGRIIGWVQLGCIPDIVKPLDPNPPSTE